MTSPRPPSAGGYGAPITKQRTSSAHHAESPLRKMSFPVNEITPIVKRSGSHDNAFDDDDEVIHVEPLSRSVSRVQGGGTPDVPDNVEGDDEAPILASDEVAKFPGGEYLQPAVPHQEEYNEYLGSVDADGRPLHQGIRLSRPTSRSNSAAGITRYISHDEGTHTPLEGVKEYEPLFPDEEGYPKKSKLAKHTEVPKRPDVFVHHHFPSKDIWEDTPSSLMYVTTVETPPPGVEKKSESAPPVARAFEPPEAEKARQEITPEDQEDFLSEHTKRLGKPFFNRDVQDELPVRPGMERRFPSQDIWEDSPSQSLITTVITPDPEAQTSPQEAKKQPHIPPRPSKGGVAIPPRPAARMTELKSSSPEDKKAPSVPDRPKPQIPARPQKTVHRDSPESEPLSKSISAGSGGSDSTAVPSEPMTFEKRAPPPKPVKQFGGIKGGFISELQNKLQLGPQAVKKEAPPEEKEEEKAPLADARKGRARGPQRRKPGTSPSAAAAVEAATSAVTFNIAVPIFSLDISPDGSVSIGGSAASSKSDLSAPESAFAPEALTPPLKVDATSPEVPEGGYFDPISPTTSTKAVAAQKADPPVSIPEPEVAPKAAEPETSLPTSQTAVEPSFDDTDAHSGGVVVKGGEEPSGLTATADASDASKPVEPEIES